MVMHFINRRVKAARTLVRDRAGDDENKPGRLLTKFGEMHSRGELSETEYRTIKTVLATEVQDELKGTAEKG